MRLKSDDGYGSSSGMSRDKSFDDQLDENLGKYGVNVTRHENLGFCSS